MRSFYKWEIKVTHTHTQTLWHYCRQTESTRTHSEIGLVFLKNLKKKSIEINMPFLYNSIERLPAKFKTRRKVQTEENYLSSYVNVSFVHDDEIRRKSIELFYQMINHEIEHTSNIEHVSSFISISCPVNCMILIALIGFGTLNKLNMDTFESNPNYTCNW